MFWFPGPPYCAVAVFNKWSSVYLYLPVWVCACVFLHGCDSSVSPAGPLSHPAFPSPRWHYSAQLITCHHLHPFRDLGHTHKQRGGWIHSHLHTGVCGWFLCGHDGGCLLQVSQWCSSIAAPEGSLTGRPRAQWAPHPPPGSIWLGWRVPAPEPLSQAWMDLAYLYSHSVTQGDPNLTMPLWLCPATLYLCVRRGVCASVLFNRRACSCCAVGARELCVHVYK